MKVSPENDVSFQMIKVKIALR